MTIHLPPRSFPGHGPQQTPATAREGFHGSVIYMSQKEDTTTQAHRSTDQGYRAGLSPRHLCKFLANGQTSTDLNITRGHRLSWFTVARFPPQRLSREPSGILGMGPLPGPERTQDTRPAEDSRASTGISLEPLGPAVTKTALRGWTGHRQGGLTVTHTHPQQGR